MRLNPSCRNGGFAILDLVYGRGGVFYCRMEKIKPYKGSIRTLSVPRTGFFYVLAGRVPIPNTANHEEEAQGQGLAAIAVALCLYKN